MSRPSSSKENVTSPSQIKVPSYLPRGKTAKQWQDEQFEDELLTKLSDLLRQNRKSAKSQDNLPSSDFCCDAAIDQVPRLVIDDNWELKYPCDAEIGAKLLTYASVAPVGKGSKTVMDKEVRDGWQIGADKVKFLGERWTNLFSDSTKSQLLESVRLALTPDCKKISAKFYKLLVYEKDSFFKLHRDTQRQRNHFGSIVVFLPSCYSGGEFLVELGEASRKFSFGLNENSDTLKSHMVAFFADCLHEVKPVTSGYRVTMSYQLFYEDTTSPTVPRPLSGIEKEITDTLSKLFELPTFAGKQAAGILLQHRYALASVQPILLKGIDRVVYNAVTATSLYDVEVLPVNVSIGGTNFFMDDNAFHSAETYYKDAIREEYFVGFTISRLNPLTVESRNRVESPVNISKRYDDEWGSGNNSWDDDDDDDDDDDEDDGGEKKRDEDCGFRPRPEPSPPVRSPISSNDEDEDVNSNKVQGEMLSAFDNDGGDVHGSVAFINRIKDIQLDNLTDRHTRGTGNEGTEFELQYNTAAMLIKPKNSKLIAGGDREKSAKRRRKK